VISAILLAAGQSRRFGAQKLLQRLATGRTVVNHSADNLALPLLHELVVVIDRPPDESEVASELLGWAPAFVVNRSGGGMASSLAAGVAALDPASEAVLVALGDEPQLPGEAIKRVVARYRQGGADVIVPRYRGVRGHPVLFSRAVYPELIALSGDHGAKAVADRDPTRLAFVDIDLPKPIDVDTPGDLARLRP
jgi:molybdenum cofactor cytidylyltransferase